MVGAILFPLWMLEFEAQYVLMHRFSFREPSCVPLCGERSVASGCGVADGSAFGSALALFPKISTLLLGCAYLGQKHFSTPLYSAQDCATLNT